MSSKVYYDITKDAFTVGFIRENATSFYLTSGSYFYCQNLKETSSFSNRIEISPTGTVMARWFIETGSAINQDITGSADTGSLAAYYVTSSGFGWQTARNTLEINNFPCTGSNRYILVTFSCWYNIAPSQVTVTMSYNGQSLSKLVGTFAYDTRGQCEIWGLEAPTETSSSKLEVTMSSNRGEGGICIMLLNNVTQSNAVKNTTALYDQGSVTQLNYITSSFLTGSVSGSDIAASCLSHGDSGWNAYYSASGETKVQDTWLATDWMSNAMGYRQSDGSTTEIGYFRSDNQWRSMTGVLLKGA